MSLKKIDKEFLLTDGSVNCYGFRLETNGFLIGDFKKNPIGFYMHNRDGGVVLKWEDIQQRGDAIYAKPVVNLAHPRGQQTVDEIENGFLNAASVGFIKLLKFRLDPHPTEPEENVLVGEQWGCSECSIVDIPGNSNALAQLFDASGSSVKLSDLVGAAGKAQSITEASKQTPVLTATLPAKDNKYSKIEHPFLKFKINELDRDGRAEKLYKDNPNAYAVCYFNTFGAWPKSLNKNPHYDKALCMEYVAATKEARVKALSALSYEELCSTPYGEELYNLDKAALTMVKERDKKKKR